MQMLPDSQLPLLEGDALSQLDICVGERLGGGSSSRVYKAMYNGDPVAVKLMHPHEARREDKVQKLLGEAHLMAKMNHSNIIKALAICYLPPAFCGLPTRRPTWGLVLELSQSGPLASLIREQQQQDSQGPQQPCQQQQSPTRQQSVRFAENCQQPADVYTDVQALTWCLDIAKALDFLHSQKPPIIHRDVKPDNILLVQESCSASPAATPFAHANTIVAKLADFGSHVVLDASKPISGLRQRSTSVATSFDSGPSHCLRPMSSVASIYSQPSATSQRTALQPGILAEPSDLLHHQRVQALVSQTSRLSSQDHTSQHEMQLHSPADSAASSLARRLHSFVGTSKDGGPGGVTRPLHASLLGQETDSCQRSAGHLSLMDDLPALNIPRSAHRSPRSGLADIETSPRANSLPQPDSPVKASGVVPSTTSVRARHANVVRAMGLQGRHSGAGRSTSNAGHKTQFTRQSAQSEDFIDEVDARLLLTGQLSEAFRSSGPESPVAPIPAVCSTDNLIQLHFASPGPRPVSPNKGCGSGRIQTRGSGHRSDASVLAAALQTHMSQRLGSYRSPSPVGTPAGGSSPVANRMSNKRSSRPSPIGRHASTTSTPGDTAAQETAVELSNMKQVTQSAAGMLTVNPSQSCQDGSSEAVQAASGDQSVGGRGAAAAAVVQSQYKLTSVVAAASCTSIDGSNAVGGSSPVSDHSYQPVRAWVGTQPTITQTTTQDGIQLANQVKPCGSQLQAAVLAQLASPTSRQSASFPRQSPMSYAIQQGPHSDSDIAKLYDANTSPFPLGPMPVANGPFSALQATSATTHMSGAHLNDTLSRSGSNLKSALQRSPGKASHEALQSALAEHASLRHIRSNPASFTYAVSPLAPSGVQLAHAAARPNSRGGMSHRASHNTAAINHSKDGLPVAGNTSARPSLELSNQLSNQDNCSHSSGSITGQSNLSPTVPQLLESPTQTQQTANLAGNLSGSGSPLSASRLQWEKTTALATHLSQRVHGLSRDHHSRRMSYTSQSPQTSFLHQPSERASPSDVLIQQRPSGLLASRRASLLGGMASSGSLLQSVSIQRDDGVHGSSSSPSLANSRSSFQPMIHQPRSPSRASRPSPVAATQLNTTNTRDSNVNDAASIVATAGSINPNSPKTASGSTAGHPSQYPLPVQALSHVEGQLSPHLSSRISSEAVSLPDQTGGWGTPDELMAELVYALTGHAGTALYMAPEVASQELYNEKADVYSFAMVLYEVLGRTLLLTGRTREEVGFLSSRIQAGYRPRRLERIQNNEIWSLIQWCWAHDPVTRPSMRQVVQRLSSILASVAAAKAAQDNSASLSHRPTRSSRLQKYLGSGQYGSMALSGKSRGSSHHSRPSRVSSDERSSAHDDVYVSGGDGRLSGRSAAAVLASGANATSAAMAHAPTSKLEELLEPPSTNRTFACCGPCRIC